MANATINQLTAVSSVTNADEIEVQKSGEATTKKATVAQLTAVESAARAAQDDAIEAGVGLNTDGTYKSLINAWYIRAAEFAAGITDRGGASGALTESVENALRILDAAIYVINSTMPSFIKTITVRASSADILACNAVPKTLIPALAGYVTEIISIYGYNKYNSAAFSAGTDKLTIGYSGGSTMFEFSNAFLETAADMNERGLATANQTLLTNTAIVMSCATAPTTGNGYIDFVITYRQHAVS